MTKLPGSKPAGFFRQKWAGLAIEPDLPSAIRKAVLAFADG
jgi:hypothetical protein